MGYRYLAVRFATKEILAELPLTGVSYSQELNNSGTFSATLTLPVDNPAVARLYAQATAPRDTLIYVELDGVLQDGFCIWGRRTDGFTYQLSGSSLWSYYRRRILPASGTTNTLVAGVVTTTIDLTDQITIANNYISSVRTKDIAAGSPVAFNPTLVGTPSGVLRQRVVLATDVLAVATTIEQLSACDNGFDFVFFPRWNGNTIEHVFQTFYPHRGRTYSQSGLVCDLSSQVATWDWVEERSDAANVIHAIGAGEGTAMITGYRSDAADLVSSVMFEGVVSYKDVTVQTTIDDIAQRALKTDRTPMLSSATLVADAGLEYGSYSVGDEILVRIGGGELPAFPDGLSDIVRIKTIATSVTDGGESIATVTFTQSTI